MDTDARDVVSSILLELVRLPSHRLSLRGDHAHPLILERLRVMADMQSGTNTGMIEVKINSRPWEIAVAITTGLAGDQVELSARPSTAA